MDPFGSVRWHELYRVVMGWCNRLYRRSCWVVGYGAGSLGFVGPEGKGGGGGGQREESGGRRG